MMTASGEQADNAATVHGVPGDMSKGDCWGLESLRTVLAFGNGSTRKPLASLPVEQLLVFQHKLKLLAQTPGCFVKPHPEYTELQADFTTEQDRAAALELTKRLEGVSRWKPNLVPRLVSEKQFFSNFFGFVAATAEEHFSDERNLQYFYSDDAESAAKGGKDNAAQQEAQQEAPAPSLAAQDESTLRQEQQVSLKAVGESETAPSKPVKPATMTPPSPPTKPSHLRADLVTPHEPAKGGASSPAAYRFEGTMPVGATNAELQAAFKAKKVLFYVERNMNSNAVVYEANVSGSALDPTEPVKVYWILYAREPIIEEGLNFVERNSAYGSTTVKATDRPGYALTLSALPTKPIFISVGEDGQLHARTSISGAEHELVSVFVQSTTSWGMPKVEYIDVKGRCADGTFVVERLKP